MSTATASASATTHRNDDDDDEDCCPICLEELQDLVNAQTRVARFICCGKVLCGSCASDTQDHIYQKYQQRIAAEAAAVQLAHNDNDDEDNQAALATLAARTERAFDPDTCPMCRTPHAQTDEEKFAHILKHAMAGKAWAQYQLAERYEYGQGVKQNVEKTMEWHIKAATEHGFAPSQWALGLIHMNGRCGQDAKDVKKAIPWLEMAIAQGHAGAMCTLAFCYFSMPGKVKEGKALLTTSAEKRFPFAEYLTATNYHQGVCGYPQDKAKAMEYYKRAALQNHDMAQFNLAGTLYQDGNLPAALFWWRQCAQQTTSSQRAEAIRVSTLLDQKMNSNCAACNKPKDSSATATPMMRCAACQVPRYCNRDCQVFHWKMGHKVECKQVQELKKQVEDIKKENYYFGQQ